MRFTFYAIAIFLLASCDSKPIDDEIEAHTNEATTSENIDSPQADKQQSIIRKNQDLIVGKIYTDTLLFLDFNDDYDYIFGTFITKNLDTVELVTNEDINQKEALRSMVVNWKLDSLYEAGENDELYFQERLISYEIIPSVENSFIKFASIFYRDYSNNEVSLNKYVYDEIGYYRSINPGVYCILDKVDSITVEVLDIDPSAIYNTIPAGDFCEGYLGVKNGYYIMRITHENLPTFYSPVGDGTKEEKYFIPSAYKSNELIRVSIIKGEYHRGYQYFIQIEDKWYLFAQDLCDCSA